MRRASIRLRAAASRVLFACAFVAWTLLLASLTRRHAPLPPLPTVLLCGGPILLILAALGVRRAPQEVRAGRDVRGHSRVRHLPALAGWTAGGALLTVAGAVGFVLILGPLSPLAARLQHWADAACSASAAVLLHTASVGGDVIAVKGSGPAATGVWTGAARTQMIWVLPFGGALLLAAGTRVIPARRALLTFVLGSGALLLISLLRLGGLLYPSYLPPSGPGQSLLTEDFDTWPLWACASLGMMSAFACGRLTAPWSRRAANPTMGTSGWAAVLSVVLVILGGASLVVALRGGWSVGHREGRVLFDDAHNENWEGTLPPFTEQYLVADAPYTFGAAAEFLGHSYQVRVNEDQPITPELLATVDILILKTPEREITGDETLAIVDHVQRGGGLLLLGDHTDLLGSNSRLNRVANRFGLHFGADSVANRAGDGNILWQAPWLSPDTSLQGLDETLILTGCSIAVSPGWGRAEVACIPESFADAGDYASSSHFGDFQPTTSEPAGSLCVLARVEYGRGRVMAMSDSTILNGFALYRRSHDRLLQCMCGWLNARAVGWSAHRIALAIASLALLMLGFATLRGRAALLTSCGAAALLLGFWVSVALSTTPLPAERVPIDRVAILGERCVVGLPPTIGRPRMDVSMTFDTAAVHLLRMGFLPYWHRHIRELTLRKARVAVLFDPRGPWDPTTASALRTFMEDGGLLLVFQPGETVDDAEGRKLRQALFGRPDLPGSEWAGLRLPDPQVSAMTRPVGEGRITCVASCSRFSRLGLGHCFEPVLGEKKALFDTLRAVMGLGFRGATRSLVEEAP